MNTVKGEGFAYFQWRVSLCKKYGPMYFDTEGGARLSWELKQALFEGRMLGGM